MYNRSQMFTSSSTSQGIIDPFDAYITQPCFFSTSICAGRVAHLLATHTPGYFSCTPRDALDLGKRWNWPTEIIIEEQAVL